ncbi:MAG: hypothetical protein GC137_01055 [Alphaproteobacteria bacterium]|nr:hypothetical protein [Alphaproteobacteria bacterium]
MPKSPAAVEKAENQVDTSQKICEVTVSGVAKDVKMEDLRNELLLEGQQNEVTILQTAEVQNDNNENALAAEVECKTDKMAETETNVDETKEEASIVVESISEDVVETIVAKLDPEKSEEEIQEELAAEVANDLANIEPAAGEDGGNQASAGGYGFQSSFDPQGVVPIDYVGPIDPTALQYGFTPFRDESGIEFSGGSGAQGPANDFPEIEDAKASIDESDDQNVVTGTLNFNFGGDGAGTIGGNGVFANGLGGPVTSGGVEVEVTFDPATGTYTGSAGGETVFTMQINADGTFTFTKLGPLDHPDATDPNDVIPLQFGVTITDGNGDTQTAIVTINVADDGPEINHSFTPISENGLSNGPIVVKKTLDFDFGADGGGEISGTGLFQAFFQVGGQPQDITSGGEAIKVESTDTGGYVGLTESGEIAFTLEIDPATGEYVFTLYMPIDHPDGIDVMWLTFQVQIIDADGDISYAYIGIDLHDGNPSATGSEATVDETFIGSDGSKVEGKVKVDFGGDGPGEVNGNGEFKADVDNLTSNGEPVEVKFDADSGTYTGYTESGDVVFTLEINADGTYTFTLLGPLDHPDGTDPNDAILLNFGVIVTDGDGDSVFTTITINVLDDGPEINLSFTPVSENDLSNGPIVVKKTLDFDFGSDGAGEISGTGVFQAFYEVGGQPQDITSGGEAIKVESTDTGGYVGLTESGEIAFTLEIDPTTGEYVFTQYLPIDHPEGVYVMWLTFQIQIVDGDGDIAISYIGIDLHDGTPSIEGDRGTVDESALDDGDVSVKGKVSANFGGDGEGEVAGSGRFASDVELTSNGEPVEVKFDADSGTYTGYTESGDVVFTLQVNADGTYTFTLLGTLDHPDATDPNDAIVLSFGVIVTDGDGDTAQAGIHITVLDDGPSISVAAKAVDEDGLVNGPIEVTKQINYDFGADGPGEIQPTGLFMAVFEVGGQAQDLMSNGQLVTVTTTDTGYIGVNEDGETVFELSIDPVTGEYTYTQYMGLDHPDPTQANERIWLKFQIQITDADGDTATTFIQLDIADSGPEIDLSFTPVSENSLEHGPIKFTKTLDFDFGGDGAGEISGTGNFQAFFQVGGVPQQITSGGELITVTSTDTGGYVGMTAGGDIAFTLEINPITGEYTFTQYVPVDHPAGTDVMWLTFEVQITDADGDTAISYIGIDLHDSVPVAVSDTETLDLDVAAILSGDVTANDQLSQDVENLVTQVKFGGDVFDLPEDGSSIQVTGQYGILTIDSTGAYTYEPFDNIFGNTTATFEATAAHADGLQTSVTMNGITIEVAGVYNGDLTFVSDPQYGSGFGVDDLNNPHDSQKVFAGNEALNVSLTQAAMALTLAIADIGPNNVGAGLDYIVTLSDGSSVSLEQQFVAGQIVDGVFTFTIDSSMFGGLGIVGVYLESTNEGQFAKSSWLLNSVTAEYPGEGSVTDVFCYTLADADGDTSTALLTINTQSGDQPSPQPIADVQQILFDDVLSVDQDADVKLFEAIEADADFVKLDQADAEFKQFDAIIADTDAITQDIAFFVEKTEAPDVNVVDFKAHDAKAEFVALDVNIANDNGFIQNDETNVV